MSFSCAEFISFKGGKYIKNLSSCSIGECLHSDKCALSEYRNKQGYRFTPIITLSNSYGTSTIDYIKHVECRSCEK